MDDPDGLLEVQNLQEISELLENYISVLREITSRKYLVQTKIIFLNDFELETIALFDTGADLSCIRYDLVPKCFHKKTKEKLTATNDSELTIGGKVEA